MPAARNALAALRQMKDAAVKLASTTPPANAGGDSAAPEAAPTEAPIMDEQGRQTQNQSTNEANPTGLV
jgi:hypothetical protein